MTPDRAFPATALPSFRHASGIRTFHGFNPDLDSVLVRTDYTDEAAWQRTLAAATAPYGDEGFRAEFFPVSSPDREGATETEIREVAAVVELREPAIFVVAPRAMHAPHEILVLDPRGGQPSFRCPADKVSEPQNNLALSNLDFGDFAGAADGNGMYRGFD